MNTRVLLLVLLCLPALTLGAQCVDGATKTSGCSDCLDGTATSDCNFCNAGYWKSGPKACTACSAGTGRAAPPATVAVETSAVCTIKSAPQLKCNIANDRYSCTNCPSGSYSESGIQFGQVLVNGCSTDCKSLSGPLQFVPNTATPAITSCVSCTDVTSNCVKCAYAPTIKACAGAAAECAAGFNKQLTSCSQCDAGYYLVPNKDEPTAVVPTCGACGANCMACKDSTQCTSCWPGWALDGTDKANCLKSVPVSASSLIQAALISMITLYFAW